MTESAYLKDEVGGVLARGLAATASARPADPVEHLALWLLHYLQKKDRKTEELEKAKKVELEREEWAKTRAIREKSAAAVIQHEWKAFTHSIQDAQRREAELRQKFNAVDEAASEKFAAEEVPVEGGEKSDKEKEAELERLRQQTAFNRMKLYINELDKSYIANFKRIPASNASAITVLKSILYLQGLRPKQVDTWDKIRSYIKAYPFLQWLQSFNPCGTPLERKRKITRARRLLTTVNPDAVKAEGAALNAVYEWVSAAVSFREARDEHVRLKKAVGKDNDEELDEEEEAEDEEKDPQEEVVKAAEAEQKRAEAEAKAAAGNEGEVAPEGADE